jgi:predicted nucleotidyltransferase component of viral defense system
MSAESSKAASVRRRLLNRARAAGEDYNALLTRYAVERFLYRLGRSEHRERFVVKGAMLFVLWEGDLHRMTRDLDLLGFGSSAIADVEQAVREIVSVEVEDDGVAFAAETVRGDLIREEQEYEGVRVRAEARVGSARVRLKVDVGFGDVITPEAVKAEFPTLLDAPPPVLRAYPKETVIAEKLQAMVALGILNSRMKDFYDLWHLARRDAFDGPTLVEAVRATLARRGTPLPASAPLALTDEFATDAGKQTQWRAFVRRGQVSEEATLVEVIADLRRFLLPVLEAARTDTPLGVRWEPGGPWA